MLTNYKEQCESKVKQYIEDTTGLKLDNLSLNDYEQFLLDYKEEVVHTLSTAYEDSIKAGYNNQGEIYHQQNDFEKAINQHLDKELNDEKNLKLLSETIQKSTYGKYIGKFLLADKSSIFYEHSCQNCNGNGEYGCLICDGKGKWHCDKCNGKGEIRCEECGGKGEWRCNECNGHGEYQCTWCKGSGWDGEIRCSLCDGRRMEYCEQCGGSNYKYYPKKGAGYIECRKCNSQGNIKCDWCHSGLITCSTCRGTTIKTCSTCEGEGKATKIAQIQIHATSKYTTSYPENTDDEFKNIISKYQANEIENIANITRTTINQDEKNKCVVENYQIQIPFARFNLVFNKQKFAWLVYGKNMQIAEEQNDILLAILADDLNALAEVAKHSSWSDTKILKKSQAAVAQFISSKINTELIESDTKSAYLDLERIDERVWQIYNNNANLESLSKDYIKNALSSFSKMAGSFVRGATLRYFALAFLISFVTLFIVPYPYNLLCPIVIFPLLIAISTAYKKQSFIKLWGEKLALWADKKHFIIPRYRLYTIIGAVCVYACVYFIESLIETPTQTPKVQAQNTQNKQPKAQSSKSEKKVLENSQRANVVPENKPNLRNELKTPASEAKNETQAQSVNENSSQSSVKPSFDCNKASTTTERLVCSDDELASLDLKLANAYKNARNLADVAGKKKILEEQKIWLKAYNLCKDKDCVKQNLEQRIKDLNQMSGAR